MAKDSAAQIELGRSFHQEGTVHLKVCESDFVPLWDGTIKQRSQEGFLFVHTGTDWLAAAFSKAFIDYLHWSKHSARSSVSDVTSRYKHAP